MAMVHLAEGPTLREADLACPACGAAFRVREGIAWFHAPSPPPADAERATSAADAPHDPDVAADRLAALLGVADGPWPVLLAGERATLGAALAARVSPPQWWLNPPTPAPPRPRVRRGPGRGAPGRGRPCLHPARGGVLPATT